MTIGDRRGAMREEKQLSSGDVQKRTGLLRCYISRVENGHTVPAIEALEKLAGTLECPGGLCGAGVAVSATSEWLLNSIRSEVSKPSFSASIS